jgi:hypothetical protein
MAVLALALLGGMMLADDLYCLGIVKAMSKLSAREMPATRSSICRRSHKIAAFVTQFGVFAAGDERVSALVFVVELASGFSTRTPAG